MKRDREFIVVEAVFIFLATVVGFCLFWTYKGNTTRIIKDPVIIYNDLSIKRIDNTGVYGVISEKELYKVLEGIKTIAK